MAERVTAEVLIGELGRLRSQLIPKYLSGVGREVIGVVIREGAANIYGRVLASTRPNAELARYFTGAMSGEVHEVPGAVVAGLPASDEEARILAHRERGGTIRPRTKQFLRIPLPAARTPAGEDRFAGIDLKSRIGTPGNPFFVYRRQDGAAAYLAKRTPGSANLIEAHYVLKRSVTTRPHPWFSRAVATAKEQLPAISERHLGALEAQP